MATGRIGPATGDPDAAKERAMLTPIVTESRRLSPHASQLGLVRAGLRQARPAKPAQLPPRELARRPRPTAA